MSLCCVKLAVERAHVASVIVVVMRREMRDVPLDVFDREAEIKTLDPLEHISCETAHQWRTVLVALRNDRKKPGGVEWWNTDRRDDCRDNM